MFKVTFQGMGKVLLWVMNTSRVFVKKEGFSHAMPKKHHRPDAEIELFAAELASRWHRSDGIGPWLRSIREELFAKHRQRWTWESIARALNRAGIQYETGRLWTGDFLRKKLDDVVRRGPQPSRAALPAPAATRASVMELPASPLEAFEAEPDEPEFKPATLLNWSGAMINPATKEKPIHEPESVSKNDQGDKVDSVLARLMGKQNQPTGKD